MRSQGEAGPPPNRLRMAQIWALALAALLSGCQGGPPARWLSGILPQTQGRVPIATLYEQRPLGDTVVIRGTVGDRIPLVNGQVYALEDGTGSIWVVTTDTAIGSGDELIVEGTLAYEATPEFGPEAGELYLWEVNKWPR